MSSFIRRNSIAGLVQTAGFVKTEIKFSETWDGESLIFEVKDKITGKAKSIELSGEELTTIAAVSAYLGKINLGDVSDIAYGYAVDEDTLEDLLITHTGDNEIDPDDLHFRFDDDTYRPDDWDDDAYRPDDWDDDDWDNDDDY